jgi:hypothetical protein
MNAFHQWLKSEGIEDSPDTIPLHRIDDLYGKEFEKRLSASCLKYQAIRSREQDIRSFNEAFYTGQLVDSHLTGKSGLAFLETLMAWKMVRGKYRPTLLPLIQKNDQGSVGRILQEAGDFTSVGERLRRLQELKGVGPATASLVASVYDPKIAFFSDQAASLLLQSSSLKYTEKELFSYLNVMNNLEISSKASISNRDLEKCLWTFCMVSK